MRIIAGKHRSRKLLTLEGMNTRPTQDKIKGAMFSALGGSFYEGRVLDLFAGSGSIGLECLSRGMKEAYLCDISKDAMMIIKKNVYSLKEEANTSLLNQDYRSALETLANMQFSLIFMDPPYALKVIEECLFFIDEHHMLDTMGSVVVESHKEDVFQERYGNLVKYKEKTYGITRLSYYRRDVE